MKTTTNNQIIKGTYNNACDLNKFRTFAKIFRDTIQPFFSAEMNREAMLDMTFQEWAGYMIGDSHWSHIEENKMNEFIKLAKEKGVYAEENIHW